MKNIILLLSISISCFTQLFAQTQFWEKQNEALLSRLKLLLKESPISERRVMKVVEDLGYRHISPVEVAELANLLRLATSEEQLKLILFRIRSLNHLNRPKEASLLLNPKSIIELNGHPTRIFKKSDITPVIEDFQVNENIGRCGHYEPVIAMNSSGIYVVVWTDERNGSYDIFCQRYNKNGNKLGSNFQVNDDNGHIDCSEPDVAINNSGNFIISWNDKHNIYCQRYSSNGIKQGTNFKVNDDGGVPSPYYSSIGMDSKGNFVIVWGNMYETTPLYKDNFIDNSLISNGSNNNGIEFGIYCQRYRNDGSRLGTNFKVDDVDSSSAFSADLCVDINGNFIVVWEDMRNDTYDIYCQRFDNNGVAIGGNFKVNDDAGNNRQSSTAVEMDKSGNFIIAWGDGRNNNSYDIFAQRYSSDGKALGANFQVNEYLVGNVSSGPDIGVDEDGYFTVVWGDDRNDHYWHDIYCQQYDNSGTKLGNNFQVNDELAETRAWEPGIAISGNGDFIVVWQEMRNFTYDIYYQYYDNHANPKGQNYKVNDDVGSSYQHHPSIGVDGNGNIMITWEDTRNFVFSYDIYSQRFNNSYMKIGTNFQVNDNSESIFHLIRDPANAMNYKGHIVVVWQNGADDILSQRFDNNGRKLGKNFQVNEAIATHSPPDISIDNNGSFAIVWEKAYSKICCQRYINNGTKLGNNFEISDIGYQDSPAISMDANGNFVVIWKEGNILAQYYDNNGIKQGSKFQVNDNPGDMPGGIPDIAMDREGNFVVVWFGGNNGNYNIYCQRFNSYCVKQNTNFKVNDNWIVMPNYPLNFFKPAIGMDKDGSFVIVWQDELNGDTDIYAQRYDKIGHPIGTNYRVNNDTGNNYQGNPDVKLINGLIYYTWEDTRVPGQGYDIFARVDRFNSISESPIIEPIEPDSNATGIARNTHIKFKLTDDKSGLDLEKFFLKVNYEDVTRKTVNFGDLSDMTIIYNSEHTTIFEYNQIVWVHVHVADRDGNVTDCTYKFTTKSTLEKITVDSPNGGELLQIGTSHDITWSSNNLEGNVKIELSRDSGSNWEIITSSTPDDNNYSWTVSSPTSNACHIKISSINNSEISDQSDLNFSIVEPLQANFSATPRKGIKPLAVQFSDSSNGIVTKWNWDFGDGQTSKEQNPSHTYTNIGSYSVQLIVSGPTGTNTLKRKMYILVYDQIKADFYATPTHGITPLSVNFSDISKGLITDWQWKFGDGHSIRHERNPIHVYQEPGTYTVSLKAFGGGGPDTETKADYIHCYSVIQVWLPDTSENKGSAIEIPIFVDDLTGQDIISYEFTLAYSDTVLKATGVSIDGTVTSNWGMPFAITNTPGIVKIGGYAISPLAGKGVLVKIKFDVIGNPGDTTHLEFSNFKFNNGTPYARTQSGKFQVKSSGTESITVTSPNGGENWKTNTTHTIRWSSNNLSGKIKIELSKNGGSSWEKIVNSTPDVGSYSWTVPNYPSNNCYIRIMDADGFPSDQSDQAFTISGGGEWSVPITITNNESHFVRTFGGDESATEVYDYSLDKAAAPPGLTYYAYFEISNLPNYLDTDIRGWISPYDTDIDWTLKIVKASGNTSNLIWEPSNLPTEGSFTLVGSGLNVNMCDQNYAQVAGDANLTIQYRNEVTVSYNFPQQGWYLVSLPVFPTNNQLSTLFPMAVSAYAWDLEIGNYITATTLEPKKGYWLLLLTATTVSVSGSPLTSFTEHYKQGWHLIGSVIGTGYAFADPDDNPDGAVIAAYGWDKNTNSYKTVYPAGTGEINEKEGYWLSVIQPCDLTIPGTTYLSKLEETNPIERTSRTYQFNMQPPTPPFLSDIKLDQMLAQATQQSHNYPNPFNLETNIEYVLLKPGLTRVEIYNAVGQRIRTVLETQQTAGLHQVAWDGKTDKGELVTSGIYFYRIIASEFVETKKMLLLR